MIYKRGQDAPLFLHRKGNHMFKFDLGSDEFVAEYQPEGKEGSIKFYFKGLDSRSWARIISVISDRDKAHDYIGSMLAKIEGVTDLEGKPLKPSDFFRMPQKIWDDVEAQVFKEAQRLAGITITEGGEGEDPKLVFSDCLSTDS